MLAPHDPEELLRASIQASVQSITFRNENNFEAALAASQKALELHQQSGFRENLDLQWAAVGANLRSLGRFDEALAAFRKAQDIRLQPAVWRDIVLTEISLDHLTEAEREVHAFLEAAGHESQEFRAEARIALSDLRMATGQHAGAVAAVREAVALAGADAAGERIRLEALAQLMVCVVDAMRILPYDEALALARRMDTEIPGLLFPVAPFAKRAAHVRRRLAGEFDAVLRDDVDARDAARRAGDASGEIEALRSMAATYGALNSHDREIATLGEAVSLCEAALSTAPEGVARALSRARLADTLAALGEAHLAAAQPMGADDSFTTAIDVATAASDAETKSRVADALGRAWLGRAQAALAGDRPLEARDVLDRALSGAIAGATFDRGELLLLRARAEPGNRDGLTAAGTWFDRAAEAFRAGRNGPQETRAHLSAARFFVDATDDGLPVHAFALSEATKHVRQAAALGETLNLGSIRWQIAFCEGRVAEIANQPGDALTAYRRALAELDRLRSALADDQRVSLIDSPSVELLYAHTLGLLTKAGRTDEAWSLLERAKARTFLEMLHGRRRSPAKGTKPADDELSRLERRILDLRVSLAPGNVDALRASGRDPASVENALHALEQRFLLARKQTQENAPARGQVLTLRPLRPAAVQAHLPRDAALLEYGLLPDGVTVFVVTSAGRAQLSWTTSTDELRSDVAALHEALADPDSDVEELRNRIAAVSARVVQRPIETLGPGIKQLVIVPTGVLSYVPFQVLTTAAGAPLIDDFEITYLPNASSLEYLGTTTHPDRTLFVGALGMLSVEGLDPLPGTIEEAKAIASIEPASRVAAGRSFTKSAVLDALQRDSAVHLATHSRIDEDAPMFSAILTAPDAARGSRVSLYEVMDLDLSAKLVVLSACETGLGRLRRGDEIAGLTRTFLLAGADTVVSSLWEVSDEATILLMRIFYEALHEGHAPPQALRTAALAVRERHPHPMYWAPFVVTAAPRPGE